MEAQSGIDGDVSQNDGGNVNGDTCSQRDYASVQCAFVCMQMLLRSALVLETAGRKVRIIRLSWTGTAAIFCCRKRPLSWIQVGDKVLKNST